ncbi:metallophosphoesterase [Dyadobacter bucti]|uniref:metallophosphoesterase n=1 Tax=Dyadobacter bucti TaxID=2572203 RepID=UPI003F6EAFC0
MITFHSNPRCRSGIWWTLIFTFFALTATAQQYVAPALSDKNSWSVIIVPDPQGYTKFKRNQPLLDLMVTWIDDNLQKLNIGMVLCTGDLVEQNYITELPKENGDQLSTSQWQCVANAFGKLDGKVPYILCTGNHDYGTSATENRYSQFNSYFPPGKNPLNKNILVEMAPNGEGVKTLENACYEFKPPFGQPMLVFSLEFAPRKNTLAWAKEVAVRPEYKNHTGMLLTHSYMRSTVRHNEHIVKEDYPPGFTDAALGREIFEQLVQPASNIKMVVCGHVIDQPSHAGHVGFRTDKNAGGKTVNQMLFNAQNEGGNWKGNGGDGWIRILEFLPDQKTVKVRTFSPLFAISPATRHLAWRTEPFDQYEFYLD